MVSVGRKTSGGRSHARSLEGYRRICGQGSHTTRRRNLQAQRHLCRPTGVLGVCKHTDGTPLHLRQLVCETARTDPFLRLPMQIVGQVAECADALFRGTQSIQHLQECPQHRPRLQLQQRDGHGT